jgi:hypothetical protein
VKLPRANALGLEHGHTLHWRDLMLRSFDHGLFEQPRHLAAVRALQNEVAIVIAGPQLVTMAKYAWG